MALISRLGVVLGLDAGEFNKNLGEASDKLEKFTDGLKTGLAAAAIAATGYIIESTKKAAEYADEMGKAAQKVGVTTEALSKLKYAAELSDVGFDSLQTGLKKLSVNMESAATGNKAMETAFKSFGVTVTDSKGNMKSADDVLYSLADKFAKMPDGVQKTAMAVQVFGKTGQDMIPLLNQGSEELKRLGIEASNFGRVVTSEAAKSAEEFNDNLKRMKEASAGAAETLGNKLIPTLASATAHFPELVKESGLFLGTLYTIGLALDKGIFGKEFGEKLTNNTAQIKAQVTAVENLKARYDQLTNPKNADYSSFFIGRESEVASLTKEIGASYTKLNELEKQRQQILDADAAKENKPEKDSKNLPAIVNDTNKKLTEELIKQTNELKLQTSQIGQIQSEAQKVALEFEKGGKYIDLAGTSYQKMLMTAAQGLDLKKHEEVVQKTINDYQNELAKKSYETFLTGQKITNGIVEKHKAEQLAYDLSMKDLQVSIDRLKYEATLAGMSDIQKTKLLEIYDLKAKMNKLDETNINLTDAQIEAQKKLDEERINAEEMNKRAQNTFQAGWEKAYNTFIEQSKDSAALGGQFFSNMTTGLESALDNFVQTGKLSFSSLIQSMIADLLKLQMKAAMMGIFGGGGGLSDMFSGIFGGGSGMPAAGLSFDQLYAMGTGGAYANGGSPPVGVPSLVGENGAELFVPKTAGTIIPNGSLSSMMGSQPQTVYNGTVVQNMSAIDTQSAIAFLANNKTAVWAANQSAQRSLPQTRG